MQLKQLQIVIIFFKLFIGMNTLLAQTNNHVIIISIDGFRSEMYLDKSWPTSNLQFLVKNGIYANHMKSVFPAYTYPSHTAMLTGALPARSKVNFNQPIGSKGDWFWEAKYIKTPTLWQKLHEHGMKTAAVMWPGSVGGDIDYNLSEIWDNAHPDDRATEVRKHATPPGIYEEIEANATGKLDSTNMNDNYFSLDENAGRMAAYIFKKYKPNLLALHFATVDGEEHEYGRDADSVRLAVAANDRAIGDVLQAVQQSGLKDRTTVIIVGDHGFSTIHTALRINMPIQGIPVTFISAGGSAFLYRYSGTKADDVPTLVRHVKARLDSLPEGQRKLFRIIERPELNRMGADSAALLAVAAVPGVVFSSSVAKSKVTNNGPGTLIQQNPNDGLLVPVKGGHHGYDPDLPEMYTGFIAAGAGIKKGGHIESLTVTDIAPLIAKLLGIEFNTPDGKLVPGIINTTTTK